MPHVIVVIKRTSYRLYLEDATDTRIRRLLRKHDPTVSALRPSHVQHEATVAEVHRVLEKLQTKVELIEKPHQRFSTDQADLVITIGGDGTLLSASHQVGSVPILGINSAPDYSVGFFCGAKKGEALPAIREALRGKLRSTLLSRMEVVHNERPLASRVLNEALFCHASPAATTRYIVELGGKREEQKSSGFWIGPAAGSTAAQRSAGGSILPLTSRRLQLVVREPYTPAGGRLRLTRALVRDGDEVVVRSKMHEGRLFFDGPHDAHAVLRGDTLVFRRSPESLRLLGLRSHRQWG